MTWGDRLLILGASVAVAYTLGVASPNECQKRVEHLQALVDWQAKLVVEGFAGCRPARGGE